MNAPDWLHDEILSGIQALLALRLKGSPSMETIPATANMWVTAIKTRPIAWDKKLDTPRIRKAFVDLAATAENWPSPAAFISKLQPREYQNRLAAPVQNTMSDSTRKMVDALLTKLRRNTNASE